jgi:hypothetical protein
MLWPKYYPRGETGADPLVCDQKCHIYQVIGWGTFVSLLA